MAPSRKRKTNINDEIEGNSNENASNEDDLIDGEISIYMPKRPRDSENIINIANTNKHLTREQICLLFIEVAKRTDQHLEFDISHWLSKYAIFNEESNFAQIALLIIHAAQIYGKKLDMVYEFICRMNSVTGQAITLCENTKRQAAEIEMAIQNGEIPKKAKKQRKKKEVIDKENMNPFGLFGGNMEVNPLNISKEPLQEKIIIEYKDKESDTSRKSTSICNRLRRKLMIVKILKQLRKRMRSRRPIFKCEFPVPSDNHDILNYANEEITDLDDEIPAGTRRDFFCFMGMINPMKHTLSLVHKFDNKDDASGRIDGYTGSTLLPPKYLEKNYNVKLRNPKHYYEELHKEIELWKKMGPSRHQERLKRCILIAYHIATEFMNNEDDNIDPSEITIEQCDRILNKIAPLNSLLESEFDETDCTFSQADSGIGSSIISQSQGSVCDSEIQTSTSQPDIITQILTSELRVSVDEGIRSGNVSPSLPKLSDLQPLERSLLNPSVQLVDVCDPLTKTQKVNMQQNIWLISKGGTIKPLAEFTEVPLVLNFLKLPEPKLRRKYDFSLPKSYKVLKKIKLGLKLTLKELFPSMVRIRDVSLEESERCESPNLIEDFLGFDDDVLLSPLLMSNQRNLKTKRTQSNDSGILDDDTNLLSPVQLNESEAPISNDVNNTVEESTNALDMSSTDVTDQTDSGIISENQSTETSLNLSNSTEKTDNENLSLSLSNHNNSTFDELSSIENTTVQSECDFDLFSQTEDGDNFTERVREWNLYLAPILRDSKTRSYFDIHAYGQKIVSSFSENESTIGTKPSITFKELIPENEKSFTARYFLSILQLANMGNVELVLPKDRSKNCLIDHSELNLKLLNKEIRHEAMDEAQQFEIFEPSSTINKNKKIETSTPLQQIMKRCNKEKKSNTFKRPQAPKQYIKEKSFEIKSTSKTTTSSSKIINQSNLKKRKITDDDYFDSSFEISSINQPSTSLNSGINLIENQTKESRKKLKISNYNEESDSDDFFDF